MWRLDVHSISVWNGMVKGARSHRRFRVDFKVFTARQQRTGGLSQSKFTTLGESSADLIRLRATLLSNPVVSAAFLIVVAPPLVSSPLSHVKHIGYCSEPPKVVLIDSLAPL